MASLGGLGELPSRRPPAPRASYSRLREPRFMVGAGTSHVTTPSSRAAPLRRLDAPRAATPTRSRPRWRSPAPRRYRGGRCCRPRGRCRGPGSPEALRIHALGVAAEATPTWLFPVQQRCGVDLRHREVHPWIGAIVRVPMLCQIGEPPAASSTPGPPSSPGQATVSSAAGRGDIRRASTGYAIVPATPPPRARASDRYPHTPPSDAATPAATASRCAAAAPTSPDRAPCPSPTHRARG